MVEQLNGGIVKLKKTFKHRRELHKTMIHEQEDLWDEYR